MDASGRLHMPGFVGQTYEETGVRERDRELDSKHLEPFRMNRRQRRIAEALDRKIAASTAALAKTE